MDPTRTSSKIPKDRGSWAGNKGPFSRPHPGTMWNLETGWATSCSLQTPKATPSSAEPTPRARGERLQQLHGGRPKAHTVTEAPVRAPLKMPHWCSWTRAESKAEGSSPRARKARSGHRGPTLTSAAPPCTWTWLCPGLGAAAKILSGLRLERPGSSHCRPSPS